MNKMVTQDCDIIYDSRKNNSKVSVIIPLYNYQNYITETITSVIGQTFSDISLVVVDDCSTDNSVDVVEKWMKYHESRNIGMTLARNMKNAKLSITRNTGIYISRSEYCFMLDADNIIYPRCIEKHVSALLDRPAAGAAYSLLEVFGGASDIIGAGVFTKDGLKRGNFIDAMAMFRRSMLLEMGGYEHIPYGWEDYDLWLRMLDADQIAIHIPEILARYRQHDSSMLRTETNVDKNIGKLHTIMKERHPWLEIS